MTQTSQLKRRQSPRLPFNGVVEAEPIDQEAPKRWWPLPCENISGTGLRLSSPEFFPVESRLLINLDPHCSVDPSCVIGKVVWVRAVPPLDRWDLGVEFCEFLDGGCGPIPSDSTTH